jgi:hypothetical protein
MIIYLGIIYKEIITYVEDKILYSIIYKDNVKNLQIYGLFKLGFFNLGNY